MVIPIYANNFGRLKEGVKLNLVAGGFVIPPFSNFTLKCECDQIGGNCCHKTINPLPWPRNPNACDERYCLYLNVDTRQQFIVSQECAEANFNYQSGSLDCKVVVERLKQPVEDLAKSLKVFKYFFNPCNWRRSKFSDCSFDCINFDTLYEDIVIPSEKKRSSKLIYKNDREDLMSSMIKAYSAFCKCNEVAPLCGGIYTGDLTVVWSRH